MSMAVGGPGGGPKSDINMTPMIDVLLVLIIIFMVITPLTPKGLEALVPQPPPPGQKETASDQRTVVISIDSDHKMMINAEADRRKPPGGPSGRDLQDARRARGFREGRSEYRIQLGGQGHRYRARRRHR